MTETARDRTVRDAALEVLRRSGLTTVFSNPGSTEIPLLAGLPPEFSFVLALHEGSVVGIAAGFAIARAEPALAVVHTAAGLGNAAGAVATARSTRAPLVVLVGQQDRRHLASEPFLAGRLEGLLGSYPVWVVQPPRAEDVPSALARAWHEARSARGPAVVIVPTDDWDHPAADEAALAPLVLRRSMAAIPEDVELLAGMLASARSPALVVGAGADHPRTWEALVELAQRLRCPVFQESFGARAGFPQDHPLFRGHLPSGRSRLRSALAAHDLVVSVGAPVFRQYLFEPGPFAPPGTRLAVVTDDPEEAHRSPVELALLGPLPDLCAQLAGAVPHRGVGPGAASGSDRRATPPPPSSEGGLAPTRVFAALAKRLDPDTVLVEETPSSRPELVSLLPARRPLGFLSAANGGLGFGLPAAVGVRMAAPERPVVAVLGDGSTLYAPQALWTAARYGVGVLVVVLSNGRYAVLDRLVEQQGRGAAPWPGFEEVDVAAIARGLGCEALLVEDADGLDAALDAVVPGLRRSTSPLLLDVRVGCSAGFEP
jgi:benzoylformate decarboxylase